MRLSLGNFCRRVCAHTIEHEKDVPEIYSKNRDGYSGRWRRVAIAVEDNKCVEARIVIGAVAPTARL